MGADFEVVVSCRMMEKQMVEGEKYRLKTRTREDEMKKMYQEMILEMEK